MAEDASCITYVLRASCASGVICNIFREQPSRVYGLRHAYSASARDLLREAAGAELEAVHRRLLMRLVMNQSGQGSDVVLRGVEGLAIVREMIATGQCYWTTEGVQPLRWNSERDAVARWERPGNDMLRPSWQITPPASVVLPLTPPVFVDPGKAACGMLKTGLPETVAATWTGSGEMDARTAARFCHDQSRFFPHAALPLPEEVPVRTVDDVTPVPCLTIMQKEFAGTEPFTKSRLAHLLVACLEFDYCGSRVRMESPAGHISALQDNQLLNINRQPAVEAAAFEELTSLGFCRVDELLTQHKLREYGGYFALRPDGQNSWQTLLSDVFPDLRSKGWKVDCADGLNLVCVDDDAWYSRLDASGQDWFAFEAGVDIPGVGRTNLLPIVHHYLQKRRGMSLEDMEAELVGRSVALAIDQRSAAVVSGSRFFLILRHLFELYREENPLQKDDRLRMSQWRAAEISELERLSESPWNLPPAVKGLAERLRRGVTLTPSGTPEGFRAVLRPYQGLGLSWLQFLREQKLSGLLGDEMGLGKTVQVLASLWLDKRSGTMRGPSLVVAPTSVVSNWVAEAGRFAPGLTVVLLHGPDRMAQFDGISRADLVITSYALLRRDAACHLVRKYHYIILDEAQTIKNARTQVAQVARKLQSAHRLCLTGTPMENHLGELHSLYEFLMPGFLGSRQAFRRQFRIPIEKHGDRNLQAALNKRLAPFLLRRSKADVEKQLPPKTEILHGVELTARQRDLYEAVRLAMSSRIRGEIERKGLAKSHIEVLHALLRLRQICCDPRLVEQGKDATARDSSKLSALLEMVPEMVEEGRHILIFSQFVSMLKIIEEALHSQDVATLKLTGATPRRAQIIKRFQSGEVPVFLISLKAGGTGLNLTRADVVILYDPWWNPAAEDQAADRAHRIGQRKSVFVYKLLTEGTVESKILALQQKKRDLLQGVMTHAKEHRLSFTEEDLSYLLAPIS